MIKEGLDKLKSPVVHGAEHVRTLGRTAFELVHPTALVKRLQREHDEAHMAWALETLELARRVDDPETVQQITLKMAQITAGGLIRAMERQAVLDTSRLEALAAAMGDNPSTDTNLEELGLSGTELAILQHQFPDL